MEDKSLKRDAGKPPKHMYEHTIEAGKGAFRAFRAFGACPGSRVVRSSGTYEKGLLPRILYARRSCAGVESAC